MPTPPNILAVKVKAVWRICERALTIGKARLFHPVTDWVTLPSYSGPVTRRGILAMTYARSSFGRRGSGPGMARPRAQQASSARASSAGDGAQAAVAAPDGIAV